ncbi:hypothetical protein MTR_7g056007 [Medicago truncatula]|uniref:Uncharacterized protein n=1 Tax=Medicago truncatula TaxID=3880 RepID=A0A072U0D3_MEDTR|nr:hypothetical protein MTR_7g056007 [Medicago truncatula]
MTSQLRSFSVNPTSKMKGVSRYWLMVFLGLRRCHVYHVPSTRGNLTEGTCTFPSRDWNLGSPNVVGSYPFPLDPTPICVGQ